RTVDGAVPRLRCEGLAVVGFEIFYCEPEEAGKGDVRAWIGWRMAIEEGADERPHLLRGQSANTHRGAAASRHIEIVPRAVLFNFPLQGSPQEAHITQILRRGREVDRADQGPGGVCGSGGVVREIDQHWPAWCFEQLQGSA